jgi:hypothetical protein
MIYHISQVVHHIKYVFQFRNSELNRMLSSLFSLHSRHVLYLRYSRCFKSVTER